LILAAGFEPVRLRGDAREVKAADSALVSNICPYVKHLLESGLRNQFGSLAGIIFTNSCDGMRRLYDLWNRYVRTPFTYMLETPKNRNELGIKYFSEQIHDLKTKFEKAFDIRITNDQLNKSISLMNDRRAMIMDLFGDQKEVPPPYHGSELLALCVEEATHPKEETAEKIKNFSGQAEKSNHSPQKLPRMAVIGNVIDNPILFKMIENASFPLISDALKGRGLPVLDLDGDMTDERNYSPERTLSKLDTFLEILRSGTASDRTG